MASRDIDECQFDSMPVSILYTQFPLTNKAPLSLPIYVAKLNLGKYEPKVGDDIDAYVWFQGRIVDYDGAEASVDPNEPNGQEGEQASSVQAPSSEVPKP